MIKDKLLNKFDELPNELSLPPKKKKCPAGYRVDQTTGKCIKNTLKIKPRCKRKTRRNNKTNDCETYPPNEDEVKEKLLKQLQEMPDETPLPINRSRCFHGYRKNIKTGMCKICERDMINLKPNCKKTKKLLRQENSCV